MLADACHVAIRTVCKRKFCLDYTKCVACNFYQRAQRPAYFPPTRTKYCKLSSSYCAVKICKSKYLTLIYPAHFEDVLCQSGVNHIFEGKNDYVSRKVIYHCKEECLSFIKKQTEIQIYKFYASYAHEIDFKR